MDVRKIQKKKAFTLVELIIVITILAILATIAFLSFQGYSKNSRDSQRLVTLNNIEKGLSIFQVQTGKLPLPDSYISIHSSGVTIGYQGEIGTQISQLLKISSTPSDVLDRSSFTYLTNMNRNLFQLVGFLENPSISFLNQSYASSTDYSKRYLKTFGSPLGVLLVNTGTLINTPLNQLRNEASFTGIEIKTFSGTLSNGSNIGDLKVVFDNNVNNNVVGTGSISGKLESTYLQKYQAIMVSCPNGWTDKGQVGAPNGLSAVVLNMNASYALPTGFRLCEGTKLDESFQVVSSSCNSLSQDIGGTVGGVNGASFMNFNRFGMSGSYETLPSGFRVCSGNNFTSFQDIIASACPNGWQDKGQVGLQSGLPTLILNRFGGDVKVNGGYETLSEGFRLCSRS